MITEKEFFALPHKKFELLLTALASAEASVFPYSVLFPIREETDPAASFEKMEEQNLIRSILPKILPVLYKEMGIDLKDEWAMAKLAYRAMRQPEVANRVQIRARRAAEEIFGDKFAEDLLNARISARR